MPLLETLFAPGAVTTLFQPIVTLDDANDIAVVECLTRGPAGTNLHRADVLFDYVRAKRAIERFDRVCIATALASLPAVPENISIAVNVHGSTLSAHDAPAFIAAAASLHDIDTKRIVLEIVEQAPALDMRGFRESLQALREIGVRFAIDDFGNGYSNLRLALEIAPELIKLDRALIDGCHADTRRRAAIGLVGRFADECGARVVAEGVERLEDVAALRDARVPLAQGWYFAKPMSTADLVRALQGDSQGDIHVA